MSGSDDRLKSETAKREEALVTFWKEHQMFEKSLAKRAPKGEFIFYDGPPFATGLPHSGSLLSSIIKDVVPRYKTMRGYRVPRVWGWDCHGLPIESMVEKKLDLKAKKDILNIGIDVFNETARSMVLQYVDEWEKYVDRVGRWVDFKNSYKTMDNSYIESVWWALRRLQDKKLLYEGRKVLMYCPHCETPLAKAEIQQDNTYKDVTDESVVAAFVLKNPQKAKLPPGTALLAWTTTPWTLPGNVALAVGKDIEYGVFERDGSHFVASLAYGMSSGCADTGRTLRGAELVGLEYEPLFDVSALRSPRSYRVYGADFVTTTDGTGIVHTAVMYGEDDFALGQKERLPMVQLLAANGTYNDLVPEWLRGNYFKKGEKLVMERLSERGLLFAREKYTHSYPHCYRCGTALIYNAVASWFINIQKVKKKMLSENSRVTWVPEHLKHGRFAHIVQSAPDWTISRNRFWASPLPIWKEKGGERIMVVGSVDELLKKTKRSGNRYAVMRHGESRGNVEGFVSSDNSVENHLTLHGREEATKSVRDMQKKLGGIDLIVVSPVERAQETAAIAQEILGLPDGSIMTDERLREVHFGEKNGRALSEWEALFAQLSDKFNRAAVGGESYMEVRRRVGEFLFDLERRYVGKRVLIITHGTPAWLMTELASRTPLEEVMNRSHGGTLLKTGQWREILFVPYPHTHHFDLDLHRPYIDQITLVDEKGRQYERIPEVIDCWVESGAMPFASSGYPRNKQRAHPERFMGFFPRAYPADFIAEYIAQTRTWFYYMHALGVLLFGKRSFKAVVSTGTILAADGSKMSKSKGNYTDPLSLMHQYGADALRFYLMGSVVMQAEDLNFRDEDVREIHNRVIGMLWNSFKFFELYRDAYDGVTESGAGGHLLDRWVLSRLGETNQAVTRAMDAYDMPSACRALRNFIDDYSTWYVRRSRDRVKGDDERDKQAALATQHRVLLDVARLAAPIMPFIAESIYQGIGGEHESVHLEEWPIPTPIDEKLLAAMTIVRELSSRGLEARDRAGIKVRQPLSSLRIGVSLDEPMKELIAEEINVVCVEEDPSLGTEVVLDTTLTDELREEGVVRDFLRLVQDARKKAGLVVSDRPELFVSTTREGQTFLARWHGRIIKETNVSALHARDLEGEGESSPLPFPVVLSLNEQ